jgi:hypothetical protein
MVASSNRLCDLLPLIPKVGNAIAIATPGVVIEVA